MTRRSAKRAIKRSGKQMSDERQVMAGSVRTLFDDGWSPIEGPVRGPTSEARDQRFRKTIRAQNANQQKFFDLVEDHNIVFATGPAGTGKTYIAIAKAVEALEAGKIGRILLSRPAVEAGESLGFLPGDLEEKLSPYLRPLYDALTDRLSAKRVRALMAEGVIEVAPIAYMRGRTLNNAYVVIDEAQNCTYGQLKMLLTRLGWHSTMVVTGDPDQTDLLPGLSGLGEISERLEAVSGIGIVRFGKPDVVRHPLVAAMIDHI
ncbi:PhoH family protein [Parvularcula sp. LCG005]|uniref:PhoH family protein n=1 Tax=Parvularcula sp. LCG005 TaxID=3078805 RepID=UPI002942432C|nr:PhoH family protein [Parvularcula sp. LCG005]WOI54607.1 PhoH family protein [Parvularcula sp. LCG005]